MTRLFNLLFRPWLWWLVVVCALSALVWWYGPLLALGTWRPLAAPSARLLTVMTLVAAYLMRLGWSQWRSWRLNSVVIRQLLTPPPGDKATAARAESPDLQAIRQRFEQALRTLRTARFGAPGRWQGWLARLGGRYLYQLPWYLVIGAPGSGKTTALRNCGLRFPLSPESGQRPVQGYGGTRHCDWWFTDQAVMIDTAGRYALHDGDQEANQAAWSGFLALLKRTRPRQPLNGVMLTVSVADLLLRSPSDRQTHATSLRLRLHELQTQLGVRLPVYLMVTKADLMAGFVDYFAKLDAEQLATPWGATFDPEADTAENLQRLGQEFDALWRRVSDGLVERLQGERDLQRRAAIFGFSNQLAGLQPALQAFAESVFAPNAFEADLQLRGFYMVSGTQEGTPINRLLAGLGRRLQVPGLVGDAQAAPGRSFFLNRLLRDVVFAESGLAGTNARWQRRRGWLLAGGCACLVLVCLGAAIGWSRSYVDNSRYVAGVSALAAQVRPLADRVPGGASSDLLPLLPALQATRDMGVDRQGRSGWTGLGLAQDGQLDQAAEQAYQRMLIESFLPRLALRQEALLRQPALQVEARYEALKTYLMLHDPAHFDAQHLKRQIESDWDSQLGRSVPVAQRAALSAHLDALLRLGPLNSPLAQDAALVATVRQQLNALPLPKRVLNRLRQQGAGDKLAGFNAASAAGDKAGLVFKRASNKPLSEGVPGLFTREGYLQGFQPAVQAVAQQLADEQQWVLGQVADGQAGAGPVMLADSPLVDAVRREYLNEYAATWEVYIADLQLLRSDSLPHAIQMLQLLSAADSPLPPLLKALSVQTSLVADPGAGLLGQAHAPGGAIRQAIDKTLGHDALPGVIPVGQPVELLVDKRFDALRRLVTAPEGGKPPLQDVMALLAEVQVQLIAEDTAIKGGAMPPPSTLDARFQVAIASAPEPLRTMLTQLRVQAGDSSSRGTQAMLGREIRAQVGDFCRQALAGRYPLDRSASREAAPADFAALFGPGGKMETLFQLTLAKHVDTSKSPWAWLPSPGSAHGGGGSAALQQFQRAQVIRDVFFQSGSAPTLRLQFKPIQMDTSIALFVMDIDGQVVRYDHGPQLLTQVQWPGPGGRLQVHLQLSPPSANAASGLAFSGPWALFRLFDSPSVAVSPGSASGRFNAGFDVGGRKAHFEVITSSVRNPFKLPELAAFSCPMGV